MFISKTATSVTIAQQRTVKDINNKGTLDKTLNPEIT